MNEQQYTTKEALTARKFIRDYRAQVDRKVAKELTKYFKTPKIREILNNTRSSFEGKLSKTQIYNLINDYYTKGGERS